MKYLLRLNSGVIATIAAIDNSTTYTGSADLTNTLKVFILTERGVTDPQVWIIPLSLDAVYNPNGHPDYKNSSHAAQSMW